MKVVIDASPLIFLAKLDLLILLDLFKKVSTTQEVMDEISAGLDKAYADALAIVERENIGKIDVHAKLKRKKNLGLDPGESSVIQLALAIEAEAIIVDDRAAIRVAERLGLRPMSTPYLMVRGVREGIIDKETGRSALERLTSFNYYITQVLFDKVRRLIESY